MKIETKYDVGDELWFIAFGEISKIKVESISIYKYGSKFNKKTGINYYGNEYDEALPEKYLYPSKKALFKFMRQDVERQIKEFEAVKDNE